MTPKLGGTEAKWAVTPVVWGMSLWAMTMSMMGGVDGQEVEIGPFRSRQHDLAGTVFALSDRVLQVRNMVYDGLGPAAYFWGDDRARPSSNGFRLYDVANENCGARALPRARGDTVTFEIPQGMTLTDLLGGSISVWCEAFRANFGEVVVDANLDLSSLPVTGVDTTAPQLVCGENTAMFALTPPMFNCESLTANLQVRWQVDTAANVIQIELLGRIADDGYMSFGVSGRPTEAWMLGADTVVADYFNGAPRARDFYLDDRAQCSVVTGACPDAVGSFTNDVLTNSVTGERADGLTLVRYRRPVTPADVGTLSRTHAVDHAIDVTPGTLTTVVWALGPVDPDSGNPFFHRFGESRDLIQFDFGRPHENNCQAMMEPPEDPNEQDVTPFLRPVLTDTVNFVAHMGPSGGARGYAAISEGRTAWGLAWYINDVLIPIIELRRGTTYTFRVSGGDDPESSSEHHPFYITESIAGGYVQKSPTERAAEATFGGIHVTEVDPNTGGVTAFNATVMAPACIYKETEGSTAAAAGGFLEYFTSLDTTCAANETLTNQAAVLEFTPNASTPDLLYYQCVTHTNLGWELHVIDANAESIVSVDCGALGTAPIRLTEDLTLNALLNPQDQTITMEVTYQGLAWLGVAFTDEVPIMVGAQAVIGLPATNAVAKYFLTQRSLAGVTPMRPANQTLLNTSIVQTASTTTLKFTKRLYEFGEHQIFADRKNTILFAHGSSNELAFHAGFGSIELLPNQCAVRVKGVLQNEAALNQQGDVGVASNDLNRPLWMWHGICAATAWGILVPLAIGASLIRKVLALTGCLPESAWFQVHRGLNALAAALTITAFALAVRAINKGAVNGADPKHFDADVELHRRTGLIIFVLTLAQAVNGILRPHLPEPHAPVEQAAESGSGPLEASNNDTDGEDAAGKEEMNRKDGQDEPDAGEMPERSTSRRVWEVLHRLLGLTLVGFTWWQVQDGLGLFALRFDEDNLDTVFWIVVACLSGLILLLALYQRVAL